MRRAVEPEDLDGLAADDPHARQARRDLQRIHRVMATRTLLLRRLRDTRLAQHAPGRPLRVLELGAGDGTVLLGVARALRTRWPAVELTLLDRLPLLTAATQARFRSLGWNARGLTCDVLDWARRGPHERHDLIVANLFLHHFAGTDLAAVLCACAAHADAVVALEPRRGWWALAASRLVGALGVNGVTRKDAVLSVRAGFRGAELSALWPRPHDRWHLREGAAGLFSHGFAAERTA